ncbi:uncharacterized protein LOC132038606 [Lycium ferocissimum]|uniref:uncharacterized protein LOC132038606 n=1 Tax=Lycium ferocissimum TaxID=112874 RepID=UPI0028166E81|nr:uncharacterized protein LOC132038606 [Lycium ferocissimum]
MKCICLHSPILLKLPSNKVICQYHKSKLLEQQQHYKAKLATCFIIKGKRTLLIAPLKAINSPAASGDLSVLLQTGAVMLFMYWIANFVVPGIVLKDLQDDSTTNNNKADEKDLL